MRCPNVRTDETAMATAISEQHGSVPKLKAAEAAMSITKLIFVGWAVSFGSAAESRLKPQHSRRLSLTLRSLRSLVAATSRM